MKVQRKTILGYESGKSKGSEVRMSLVCSRNGKEKCVAGISCSKQ